MRLLFKKLDIKQIQWPYFVVVCCVLYITFPFVTKIHSHYEENNGSNNRNNKAIIVKGAGTIWRTGGIS